MFVIMRKEFRLPACCLSEVDRELKLSVVCLYIVCVETVVSVPYLPNRA